MERILGKDYINYKNSLISGYTIEEIANIYHVNAYSVINSLLEVDENDIFTLNAIKKYYENFKINQNRCLVISDTHIGRLDSDESKETYLKNGYVKNEKGLYFAYNYALKNGIRNIVHAGDLIEGLSDDGRHKLPIDLQMEYLKKIYPNTDEINTYLLFGNHDFNLIYYNRYENDFYKVRDNIKLIGVNYSYIYFCGTPIKISHYCKTSDYIDSIDLPYDFEMAGHSHVFSLNKEERIIKIPTLSSSNLEPTGIGFLELINEENEYVLRFLNDDAKLKDEYALEKKKTTC